VASARRNDLIAGVLVVAFGAAVLLYVRGFPELAGGRPGPALFPGILGALMVLFGLTLTVQAARRPPADADRAADADAGTGADTSTPAEGGPAEGGPGATTAQTEEEMTGQSGERAGALPRRRTVANVAAVLGAVVVYLLLAGVLGFLLTMALVLALLMLWLRVRPVVALGAAVATSVLIYLLFDAFLLVPLPAGPFGS
jgi:putative tricarboxylic transport membrane protein